MNATKDNQAFPLLRSFGRVHGRKLRPAKQGLVDTLLPQLMITLPEKGELYPALLFSSPCLLVGEGGERGNSPLASALKETPLPNPPPQGGREYKKYWLEIGFGAGEHLAHQAELNRDTGIIGCEPFINGVAGLLTKIRDQKLDNVRLYDFDARLLIDKLPEACIEKIFILYPDPWPKARHNKRRLVSKELLDALSRVMMPGAELRLATDDENYSIWMLERLLAHQAFAWQATSAIDWLNPPPDWISTRYEQKALKAGRVPTYLNFRRL